MWTHRFDGRWLVCLLLLAAAPAFGANNFWTGADDALWATGANWSLGAAPTSVDTAIVSTPDLPDATIDSGGAANVMIVGQADDLGTCDVYLNGGTLQVNSVVRIGNLAGGVGTMYINGGNLEMVNATGWVGVGLNGNATLLMSSGSITSPAGNVILANNAGVGHMEMSGGVISAFRVMVGKTGTASFDMSGGTINLSDSLRLAELAGSGVMTMSGGLITARNLTMGAGTASLDMSNDATIVLDFDEAGDELWPDFKTRLEALNITGYGNPGWVDIAYDEVDLTATITAVPEPTLLALLGLGGLGLRRRR